MIGTKAVVFTQQRQTQRQIARALHSGGYTVRFIGATSEVIPALREAQPDLVIFDSDTSTVAALEEALVHFQRTRQHPPVVLLSLGADKGPLLDLILRHDIGNLVAKHGAIRAVYPVLDERELLVTCEKVLRRNIFGIDKYVGSWGIVLHRTVIKCLEDKIPFLADFEQYLIDLDCPASIIPNILTVAEELLLNAIVHAPHKDGKPRYEHLGPIPGLQLEPHEYIEVTYGCDGQRLMLSVLDRFGRLERKTVYDYLARGFSEGLVEPEDKPGGAGLGLTLAFRSIHQLIFNIQDSVRTEVIAGWYLRVATASEFRQIAKSLNVFWIDANTVPDEKPAGGIVNGTLVGRIDELTNFAALGQATDLDMRRVTEITSGGLLGWLKFVRAQTGRSVALHGCPEPFVHLATEVAGVLEGLRVRTVLVPYECEACGESTNVELEPRLVVDAPPRRCERCHSELQFAGDPGEYARFASVIS